MNELLFFVLGLVIGVVLGLVIGVLSGTNLICMIHINNIKKNNRDKRVCEKDQ